MLYCYHLNPAVNVSAKAHSNIEMWECASLFESSKIFIFCNFFKVLQPPWIGVRGGEGAAFLSIKAKNFSLFRYATPI